VNRRDATQLLSRWLPGVSGQPMCSGSSSQSAASSDYEARCTCSLPSCSLCRSGTSTAAAAAGTQCAVNSRSAACATGPAKDDGSSGSSADGSGSASQMGSAEAGSGSDGTAGGRSNATSERRWLPCWATARDGGG
jgi:hypothetical protein